jgi:uncharacterized protein YecT (DUF1311 family)
MSRILVLAFAASLAALSSAEDQATIRLATAPSGEYALDWLKPAAVLRGVALKNPSQTTNLDLPPLARPSGQAPREESMPLPFISPDSNWVFVPSRDQQEEYPGFSYFEGAAILFRRIQSGGGTIEFEPAVSGRFDEAAWTYLAKELKPHSIESTADTRRVFSANFVDWSDDSARLLISVAEGVLSQSKHEWLESPIDRWYCYFNTKSGQFELTDRVRSADSTPALHEFSSLDDPATVAAVVINAECVGKETPQGSRKERFEAADKRLNEVYSTLMTQVSSADRQVLREEERDWIQVRDTQAQLQALETWSSGHEALARMLESKTTSTEARAAELEKRVKK